MAVLNAISIALAAATVIGPFAATVSSTRAMAVLPRNSVEARAPDDPEPILDSAAKRQFETAAKELAKAGREQDVTELLRLLRELGAPERDLERLEPTIRKSLARAKSKAAAPRAVTAIRRGVDALERRLSSFDTTVRPRAAELILQLDGDREKAHRVLSHVEWQGGWVEADLRPAFERRTQIQRWVQETHRLEFDIETVPSEHSLLQRTFGERCRAVRHGGLTIHGTFTEVKLARILTQALRACALSNALRTGQLALPAAVSRARESFALLSSEAEYEAAIRTAHEIGTLDDTRLQHSLQLSGAVVGDVLVMWDYSELHSYASLMFYVWRDALEREYRAELQPNLLVGGAHWLCLHLFGVPSPSFAGVEIHEVDLSRTASPLEREAARERERILRLSKAGLQGARSYLQWLTRKHEDPPFSSTFVGDLFEVEDRLRLKVTFVVEYLQEMERFGETLRKTAKWMDADPFERFLATSGGSERHFEDRWRSWLLPPGEGLLQRVASADLGTLDSETAETLEFLNDVRARAFAAYDIETDVGHEASLSEGCRLHAEYLGQNSEQLAAWPDAHEEYSDRAGFDVRGAWAGMHSVIAPGCDDGREAIEGWLATFYHRLPLLEPGLLRIGYARAGGVAVLDSGTLSAPAERECTVVWPASGATEVTLSFAPELPNPVPGEDQSEWGYPVTLQAFQRTDTWEMELSEGLAGGTPVDCHFSSPLAPTNPILAPAGAYCLIPKQRLRPNTRYTVVARSSDDESLTWSFTTGR